MVDVTVNWSANRNWQSKILGKLKITQLNLLHQERVKDIAFRVVANNSVPFGSS